jgi:hypothetical protein
MVPDIKKRATFTGWRMSGQLSSTPVYGPFTVEVLRADSKKGYVAVLLPTRQKFSFNRKKIEDLCLDVSSIFVEVVDDWKTV